jgi:glycosyltransferase involved in cell wall biosynthesis
MSDKNPLFSIVIANYNHGSFLEEAIQSILNQSCKDFELIVVDGGSTDNSLEVIKKYEHKLSWWISEPDKGQSDAFNKGFSKAIGDFFFWLNADDILLPFSLEFAKKNIQINLNKLWFTANIIFFSEEGKILKCARGPRWKDFLFRNAPINVYGPTSIFHHSIFENAGGFDENLNFTMDTDLWMRFKNMGIKFYRINKYFWGFRVHTGSKTSHEFWGIENEFHKNEELKILKKNKIFYTKSGRCVQIFYKFFSGLYLLSFIDNIKFKGKNIFRIKIR